MDERQALRVYFTREEFDTMVTELLYSDQVSYNALCRIAEATLRRKVNYWCLQDPYLRGRGYEDDIMQEIHMRLIKTVIPNFLLHENVTGPYNDDPQGFQSWMFRVGENVKRDVATWVRNRSMKESPPVEVGPGENPDDEMERIEKLSQALVVALSSDNSVYKILTWLAQFVFVLEYDLSKIESGRMILETFEDKTLFQMYDMLLSAVQKLPWFRLSPELQEKIAAALRKRHHDDVLYGDMRYRDFFMSYKGEISGKKSISDWLNRMNSLVKRNSEKEEAVHQKGKAPSGQRRSTGRREEYGSSDG